MSDNFIRIQVCINGSTQVDVFVLFVKKHLPKQKGYAISTNFFPQKVYTYVRINLWKFVLGFIVIENRSTYDGSTLMITNSNIRLLGS